MAKRFTDTEKWKRPWYRKLPPAMRELWNYILDSCDHAGIWMEDLELAEMILGFDFPPGDYEKYLGPKLIRIDEDKVFVPSFVEFQYGELDSECRTHQSVLKTLDRYCIDRVSLQLTESIDTVLKSIDTLKDKDKDKDTDRDQDKNKEPDEKFRKCAVPKLDFDLIYEAYPRKEGKEEGIKVCKAKIKTQEDYDNLFAAVQRYRAHCEREIADKQYIKHFSSFMNKDRWRDWLDPKTGTAIETSPTSHIDWSKFT